ncbi:hypothetical protein ABID26_006214 [Mesorhizobium shonense]|uniref:Propionyl-coenzyme A carboxylase alpha polypeptide n=1 Tax=Mesorhizobium shonense TaxID=1209948 RepID=A0ABV2I398_9HYPH
MGSISNVAAPAYGLPLLPLWEKGEPKATDEGCSRERQRLTPLEHPSSVSALSRRSTFSHKGRREKRAAAFAERKQSS